MFLVPQLHLSRNHCFFTYSVTCPVRFHLKKAFSSTKCLETTGDSISEGPTRSEPCHSVLWLKVLPLRRRNWGPRHQGGFQTRAQVR